MAHWAAMAAACVLAGGLSACAGTRAKPAADAQPVTTADVGAADIGAIDGARVFVPGPWTRMYTVRDAHKAKVTSRERRTASDVGADGRWQVRFERTPMERTDWTIERTLTMTQTGEGIALVTLEDATRGTIYEFEPPLVLAPSMVTGRSEAHARSKQDGDVGEATATITQLSAADGSPRVRTTLTLVDGRTRVERVSELTLGPRGSVRERNTRTVRWGPIRVDHADEVLEEVGE
jgi:hypothetical protein